MQYIILFSILTVFIIFHFIFYFKIKDGTNQFLIFGVYAFYGLCTVVKQMPVVTKFFDKYMSGLSDVIYFICMILDIVCVVVFLMNMIESRKFKLIASIAMIVEFAILLVSILLWYYQVSFYRRFFMLGILCVGSFSLIYSIVIFIKKWNIFSVYYRVIIIATFSMICWFLGLLCLNLAESHNRAICGIGILSYFFVYAFASWNEIVGRYISKKKIDYDKVKITKNEKTVLDVMLRYNVTATKDIAKFTYFASKASIDACVYRLMSKYRVAFREDLIKIVSQK